MFTVDILALMIDGTDGINGWCEECVSPVESATYAIGDVGLTVDYGENYVFFGVNAANFTGSWASNFLMTNGQILLLDWTDFEWAILVRGNRLDNS